jgi:alpha-L-fucosidase
MVRRSLLGLSLVLLATGGCAARGAATEGVSREGTKAGGPTQDERMGWWREARFGMFIHWGLYAIPAGEWPMGDPKAGKDHAEWIRETAQIPVGEYEKLQPRFDPVKFDADLWARMAADAGMKYLVITSKHHDGFCLFESKWTDWDVMGTPFHRDVLAELSAACKRHGVRFCTYHSIMDWHHPDYLPRRKWEKEARPEAGADFSRFEAYLHHEVEEVVTKYHPGVMWFDGEWESTWNHDRGLSLYELCRRLDPKMIVNNRVDVHRGGMGGFSSASEAVGDFATPEQEIPATGMPGVDWETCMTMNDHWGFNAADKSWKSTEDLVRKLADIASKGGNFLLNIGPRADGTFPPEAVQRLAEIGAWMKTNAESIRGTSASPFDALAFGRCTVKTSEKAVEKTTKLYLHVFDWPRDRRLVLPGLGNELGRAYLLASPAADLPRARQESDTWIGVPDTAPDAIDTVVVLEVKGDPIVYKAPVIEAESDIFVKPMSVKITASSPKLSVRYTTDGTQPVPGSQLYREPIVLKDSAVLSARAFREGNPVSATVMARFEHVYGRAGTPAGSHDVQSLRTEEVMCQRYAGDWDRLPDLDSADMEKVRSGSGSASGVALAFVDPGHWHRPMVNQAAEHVALKFTGRIYVEDPDVFVFELTSDDGSKLWIDDDLVIDNDGLHSALSKRGRAALGIGWHTVVVGWFNKTGGAELSLKCGVLGSQLGPVPFRVPPLAPR